MTSQPQTPTETQRFSSLTLILLIVAGFFVARWATGWSDAQTTGLYLAATVFLGLVVWMMHNRPAQTEALAPTPSAARWLFEDRRSSWLWLVVRLFLGTEWLSAGVHKMIDPAWMTTGEALQAYLQRAVAIPEAGRPAITYGWYRDFLQQGLLDTGHYVWFAKLVAIGEVAVGLGLIVGLFVGFAAFFGALMNFSFMLAGSASTNPVLFVAAVGIMVAWKVAGYWGLDAYVLPALGVPGSPGWLFRHEGQRT